MKTYHRSECVVFPDEGSPFHAFGNMTGGYAVRVNGVRIRTSEALYQACRYPHLPERQREILACGSPVDAKMTAKKQVEGQSSRPDWDEVRVDIMEWCLRVKLAFHFKKFGDLLIATGDRDIVEDSPRREQFWGIRSRNNDPDVLEGENTLGRLLMKLRDELNSGLESELMVVPPLAIDNFQLLGRPIGFTPPRPLFKTRSERRTVDVADTPWGGKDTTFDQAAEEVLGLGLRDLGKKHAWTLVRLMFERLVRQTRRQRKDMPDRDAEDVANELLRRLAKGFPNFEGTNARSLGKWMRTSLQNALKSELKRTGRRQDQNQDFGPRGVPNPERLLELREHSDLVEGIIEQIKCEKPLYGRVLEKDLEDASSTEGAEELGITTNHYLVTRHRARRRFEKLYTEALNRNRE